MLLPCAIDSPAPHSAQYCHRLAVAGWVHAGERVAALRRVVVRSGAVELGSTQVFSARPDVVQALGLPESSRPGFRILASFPSGQHPNGPVELEVRAEFAGGASELLGRRPVLILAHDYTTGPYGDLCNPGNTDLFHRRHIYATGRPAETASPECLELLRAYLPPGASVFDIGCGIGAYAAPLRASGHAWLGCEVDPACLKELARRQLPHRRVPRRTWPGSRFRLPADNDEFDAAVLVEVLEHIRHPTRFLAEVARIIRHRALFSVPNLETLPLLASRSVVPWHLLEADHWNFFTRFNLLPLLRPYFRHVEILDYGTQPLTSSEGLPLPFHLFAICDL